jgi:hypothetical protein
MKVFKIDPQKAAVARRAKILEAKTSLRHLWTLPKTAPISFVKDPLSKALDISLSRFPDATIYMSRASTADTVQYVMETGAPCRQFDTNFLGNTTQSSILQIIDTTKPAVMIASASTKTGSSDVISVIHDAIEASGVENTYIHMVCDDSASILPFTPSKSMLVSLDGIHSFSCTPGSFVTRGTVGVLVGEDVPSSEVTLDFVEAIIDRQSLETTATSTFALTTAMFDVLFKNKVPAYLLGGSNVILVRAPEHIRTSYGLELHDEWTCLRIPRNTEAGFIVNVINDIIEYYHYKQE